MTHKVKRASDVLVTTAESPYIIFTFNYLKTFFHIMILYFIEVKGARGVTQTKRRLIHLSDPALSLLEENTVCSVSCKICFHEPREISSYPLCLKVIL